MPRKPAQKGAKVGPQRRGPDGRRIAYSEALAERICTRLADGESLRSICLDERMPKRVTVMKWLAARADFADRYARAKEQAAELMADEIIALADAALPRDGQQIDNATVQAYRLAVDSRKWVASKLLPHKYGDRLDIQQDASITVKVISGLADEPKPAEVIEAKPSLKLLR